MQSGRFLVQSGRFGDVSKASWSHLSHHFWRCRMSAATFLLPVLPTSKYKYNTRRKAKRLTKELTFLASDFRDKPNLLTKLGYVDDDCSAC